MYFMIVSALGALFLAGLGFTFHSNYTYIKIKDPKALASRGCYIASVIFAVIFIVVLVVSLISARRGKSKYSLLYQETQIEMPIIRPAKAANSSFEGD